MPCASAPPCAAALPGCRRRFRCSCRCHPGFDQGIGPLSPNNSVAFGSSPKAGYLVQAPMELVDEDHPLLYKPYDYPAYMSFRFSEAGERAENALKAYCGVATEA